MLRPHFTGNLDTGDVQQSVIRIAPLLTDAEKPKFYDTLLTKDTGWLFSFAVARADFLVKAKDIDGAAKLLLPTAEKVRDRAFGGASPDGDWTPLSTGSQPIGPT